MLQPPQLAGHYSIPSYAVARREIPQEELQDEQNHIISFSDNKMPLPNETRLYVEIMYIIYQGLSKRRLYKE